MKRLSKVKILSAIFITLLIVDQVSKVLVKTNMYIGESIPIIGSWFQLLFVENKGMAFGMQFGGDVGKIILTLFRIVLSGFIVYYIWTLLKKRAPIGVLIGFTLILTGAIGNLIDSLFYGLLFGESRFLFVANFLPQFGGYAPFMMGKVVDMLYFPLIDVILPEWFPFKSGERFVFFSPIFNVADSCVSVGAFYLILFKWKYFSKDTKDTKRAKKKKA